MILKEKAKLLELKGIVKNFFRDLSPYYQGPVKSLFKKYTALILGLRSFEEIRFDERAGLENAFDQYLFQRNSKKNQIIPLSLLSQKERVWIQGYLYLLNYYACHQHDQISKTRYLDFYKELMGSKRSLYESIFNEEFMPNLIEAMERISVPSLVIIFSQNLNSQPILFSADTGNKMTQGEALLYSSISANKYHFSKEAAHSLEKVMVSQKIKTKLTA